MRNEEERKSVHYRLPLFSRDKLRKLLKEKVVESLSFKETLQNQRLRRLTNLELKSYQKI